LSSVRSTVLKSSCIDSAACERTRPTDHNTQGNQLGIRFELLLIRADTESEKHLRFIYCTFPVQMADGDFDASPFISRCSIMGSTGSGKSTVRGICRIPGHI
jgi:hypothetical protein